MPAHDTRQNFLLGVFLVFSVFFGLQHTVIFLLGGIGWVLLDIFGRMWFAQRGEIFLLEKSRKRVNFIKW